MGNWRRFVGSTKKLKVENVTGIDTIHIIGRKMRWRKESEVIQSSHGSGKQEQERSISGSLFFQMV